MCDWFCSDWPNFTVSMRDYGYLAQTLEYGLEGLWSDLTLICKGQRFHVHRIIVCSQSQFLRAACNAGFKESLTGEIELDDDLEALAYMIHYMYSKSYDSRVRPWCKDGSVAKPTYEEPTCEASDVPAIQRTEEQSTSVSNAEVECEISTEYDPQIDIRVYMIADKYEVLGLKEVARSAFQCQLHRLRNSSQGRALVKEVLEISLDGRNELQESVARVVMRHSDEMLGDPAWIEVLHGNAEILWHILMRYRSHIREHYDE